MGEKMINLTIDGVQLQVPEGTSVMSAAAGVGIEVPHLCFLKDINEISACKVCVVEVQGKKQADHSLQQPGGRGNGSVYQFSEGTPCAQDKCGTDPVPA